LVLRGHLTGASGLLLFDTLTAAVDEIDYGGNNGYDNFTEIFHMQG
jgi:hypothetical protein